MTAPAVRDPHSPRRALAAGGVLAAFNDAGVLTAADVHVATRLDRLLGDASDLFLLGAALAVRAPRLGHVCADLATARATVAVGPDDGPEDEADLESLPWPALEPWLAALGRSRAVADGAAGPDDRPLRLVGTRLYLDRYWRDERLVAARLLELSEPATGVHEAVLAEGLGRYFPAGGTDLQRLAAASAVLRRLSVMAGGPGTGKTTTVARILALLDEQARSSGAPPPVVALAAPTGKAAARLEEAVRQEAGRLPADDATRARLGALAASTLHRLLATRPGTQTRFRHHAGNRLPHDIVVVDETSMVSLSLTARLLEAVGERARLVLVGDPGQLVSVEAGAVLGDVVGPAATRLRMRAAARDAVARVIPDALPAAAPPVASGAPEAPVGDGIVVLRRVHRFGAAVAALGESARRGDADAFLAALREGGDEVTWLPVDVPGRSAQDDRGDDGPEGALAPVQSIVGGAAARLREAAVAGDAPAALRVLTECRLLCAHRRGPAGVSAWTGRIEAWLADQDPTVSPHDRWYAGRPVLVTANDYGLRLYNGDTGVVVAGADGQPAVVFDRGGDVFAVPPAKLAAVETVHAMTIHKSQGSQFATAVVVLPGPGSRVLTRELLYTAVTRTSGRLLLVATADAIRAAIDRPVSRSSGLREALWGGEWV